MQRLYIWVHDLLKYMAMAQLDRLAIANKPMNREIWLLVTGDSAEFEK
jgi:hypothetical protein